MIRLRLLNVTVLWMRIKRSVDPEERVLLICPLAIFFDNGSRLLNGGGLNALGGLILLGHINAVGVILLVLHSRVFLSVIIWMIIIDHMEYPNLYAVSRNRNFDSTYEHVWIPC